jgi:hypothetical protein
MMFHVKHIVLLVFTIPSLLMAQGNFTLNDIPFEPKISRDQAVQALVDKELSKLGLSVGEKEFFYWVNYMRVNPSRFYTDCVVSFLKQFPEANGKEAKSLEKDLHASPKLNLLSFSLAASDAAKLHCADLALKQKWHWTQQFGWEELFYKNAPGWNQQVCGREYLYR